MVISPSLGSPIVGTVKTRLLDDTKAAPNPHLPLLSMGKHDQSCPRERLIIQSPLFWTSCFPKIKCIGVPGVSSEEVFINVRQELYTTVITLQDVLIRQCSMEHRHRSCCTSKSGGNVHLLRGEPGNSLLGLDSEGKETRKGVFALKAAYILTLY